MKRKTNTLDAEYKRRGLMRPTQAARRLNLDTRRTYDPLQHFGAEVVEFDWRGTTVWGVRA